MLSYEYRTALDSRRWYAGYLLLEGIVSPGQLLQEAVEILKELERSRS